MLALSDKMQLMVQTARHVIFKGRVQGVGFRYTTRQIADRYDLTGYVRNLPDGTVEAIFQGTKDGIQVCLVEIQDHFSGFVREVIANEKPVNPRYHDFKITY
jgi:acylphosphatase